MTVPAYPDSAEVRRFALFIGAGVVNTLFGYAAYASGVAIGLAPSVAVVVSTVAGIAFNYKTLGAVFASRGFDRLPHFIAAHAALTPLNVGFLYLAQKAGTGPYLGELAALAVVTPISYAVMRLFVFAPRKRAGSAA